MFTGIIEEIGTLARINRKGQTLELLINAQLVTQDVKVGDSIAVNGVCLTVTKFSSTNFTADVMPVTFNNTALAKLQAGSLVNLERAMAANGRFGGHIVSGHVDTIGKILTCTAIENAKLYRISIASHLTKFCIAKGSIAVDGTSLTIVNCGRDWFEISLIPHTQKESIIGSKKVGEWVNLECDALAKHLLNANQMTHSYESSKVNENFLQEHGFL